MELVNTLAYYDTATIIAVKRFIVQGPDGTQFMLCVIMLNGITPKCHCSDRHGAVFLSVSQDGIFFTTLE